jgi:hypothetical protein
MVILRGREIGTASNISHAYLFVRSIRIPVPTILFAGGDAELQLIESDDPLESGLEIFCRPPGKKPQVLTLLSGGEKALVTLALIFAVFLTNPSPICVPARRTRRSTTPMWTASAP